MSKRTQYRFDLNYKECRRIIEAIDGLIVVDKDGCVRYISRDMVEKMGEINHLPLPDDYIGKKIEDVHPTTKINRILKSGEEEKNAFYLIGGETNVARIKPLLDNGTIVGAIDYDYFSNHNEVCTFLDKVNDLSEKNLLHIPDTKTKTRNVKNGNKYSISNIVGKSSVIIELKRKIYDTAVATSTVLITGETGTGKELVAQSIHDMGPRKKEPFIVVNCAAIPDTLFESELFGYERGTFTGADERGREGMFELADRGTILLDEIDQLPYHIQPKLLRVLQESEIDKIGGKKVPVDTKVIATTNKDLRSLVLSEKFREDLYYRINVVQIAVPPLRARKEDIPLLVDSCISNLNKKLNRDVAAVSEDVYDVFLKYSWPGNVRELFNMVERAMNNCHESTLTLEYIDDSIFSSAECHEGMLLDDNSHVRKGNSLEDVRDSAEKMMIERALELNGFNKTKTAKYLKISRPTLYYKIDQFSIADR